jgi:hypothetical protein
MWDWRRSEGANVRRARLRGVLLAGAVALVPVAPAQAAPPPNYSVVNPGCGFDDVTAKAAISPTGLVRGFASFFGGICGSNGPIFYFEGAGSRWQGHNVSPWEGRVLAAAVSNTATYLLFQKLSGANQGIWATKRLHSGEFTAGRRLSTFAGSNPFVYGDIVVTEGEQWRAVWSEQVGEGESAPLYLFEGGTQQCMHPTTRRRITTVAYDERPALAARGAGGVELLFERNDGAVGEVRRIRRGTAACGHPWSFAQLSGPGRNADADPELVRIPGVNHATWVRSGRVVYANDNGGPWSVRRTSGAAGRTPELAVSDGAVFVGFTNSSNQLRMLRYRGAWQEFDLTTGNPQALVGVLATAGRATAFGVSFATQKLYAVPNL